MLVSSWLRLAVGLQVFAVALPAAADPDTERPSPGASPGVLVGGVATIGLVPAVAPALAIGMDGPLAAAVRWRLGALYVPGRQLGAYPQDFSATIAALTAGGCLRVFGTAAAHMLGCAAAVAGAL